MSSSVSVSSLTSSTSSVAVTSSSVAVTSSNVSTATASTVSTVAQAAITPASSSTTTTSFSQATTTTIFSEQNTSEDKRNIIAHSNELCSRVWNALVLKQRIDDFAWTKHIGFYWHEGAICYTVLTSLDKFFNIVNKHPDVFKGNSFETYDTLRKSAAERIATSIYAKDKGTNKSIETEIPSSTLKKLLKMSDNDLFKWLIGSKHSFTLPEEKKS